MEIKLNIDKRLTKFVNGIDFDNAIQKWLLQTWLIIRNAASVNAPYQTGTLRRSISVDTWQIRQWIVLVWSPVVYAEVREYINNLHPDKKFYFKRAYEENEDKINQLFNKILSDTFK